MKLRDETPAPDRYLRPGLIGEVWCDLFLEELKAKSAQHRVTGRAAMYLELGIPLGQVLDALKVDEAGWAARRAAWEAWKAENRAAAQRIDTPGVPSGTPAAATGGSAHSEVSLMGDTGNGQAPAIPESANSGVSPAGDIPGPASPAGDSVHSCGDAGRSTVQVGRFERVSPIGDTAGVV